MFALNQSLKYLKSFALILILGWLPSCGHIATEAKTIIFNQQEQDSINTLREEIFAEQKAQDLTRLFENRGKTGLNGCVLVAQKGQVIYKGVFGYSDFRKKEALKINTAFQLASTSKPFTAAAILILMEQGKLALDDNVEKYIPGFPYPGITIKMLLTHRSGLNDYVYFGFPYCTPENNCYLYKGAQYDNNAVLDIIVNHKPDRYFNPDGKFGYNNTNYVLLASIVEKVAGISFADFVRENIFEPLKMNNSWVYTPNCFAHHKNYAIGHHANKRQDITTYCDNIVGDKGIYSTVEDMFKWDQALYTEQLLKKETLDLAFAGYSRNKGKQNYGLGWRIVDHGEKGKDIFHNGWWHGYNASFFRRPADEITIIILSNVNNRRAYQIQDVLGVLYKRYNQTTNNSADAPSVNYFEADYSDDDSSADSLYQNRGTDNLNSTDDSKDTDGNNSADLFLQMIEGEG